MILRPPRFRPRPRRVDPTSATLWIVFGGFAASVMLWVAVQATLKKAGPVPIPGATGSVQATADSVQQVLARDSTNADALQKLADIYYDTGNWEPAIVQYRSVLRHDPSRTTALVDLGVCYYNLSDSQTAETLFQEALTREPDHAVALFNLGIVNEKRGDNAAALDYFRRCLASHPPEMMRAPVAASIERVQAKVKRR
jgi:cytochrome c-type biogenesis protein CcmH/NrfG